LQQRENAKGRAMRGSTGLPSLTPEVLLGPQFPAAGPTRFSLRDTPEQERDDRYREFFGRSVMRYDVEPASDVPSIST
jgi:hypothetical protein